MDEGKSEGIFYAFDWDCCGITWEALADDDFDAT